MVKDNEICKVYLIDRYVDCRYGMSRIVKELKSVGIDTSVGYISNLFKKYNIKTRSWSQAATYRTGKNLDHNKTFIDEQMIEWIDGFLLGDGCITPSNQTARAHSGVLYKEFCDYMRSGFTNYFPRESHFSKPTGEAIKKGGKGTWGFATLSHPDLKKQYLRWYIKKNINDVYGIKEPPDDVRITPISVMLWYLGDGYLATRENAKCVFIRLSTDSFSPDKIENILVKKLKEKNIDCYKNNDNRIVITPQGIKPFFDFIGKISPVKEYQYKFDLPLWFSIESKRMSVVAEELGITYNQLSYWVKFNYIPCLRESKISKPRFLPEHIEKIKEYIEYDKNNSKADKTKKTNLEKYGVENVFQSEDIKEKIKQTNLEKYGVEHPLQNKDILEKSKETNIERYGVDNTLKVYHNSREE
jgi:hypothetical protein